MGKLLKDVTFLMVSICFWETIGKWSDRSEESISWRSRNEHQLKWKRSIKKGTFRKHLHIITTVGTVVTDLICNSLLTRFPRKSFSNSFFFYRNFKSFTCLWNMYNPAINTNTCLISQFLRVRILLESLICKIKSDLKWNLFSFYLK